MSNTLQKNSSQLELILQVQYNLKATNQVWQLDQWRPDINALALWVLTQDARC